MHSTPQSPAAWEWVCRSAAQSLKRMAAACGPFHAMVPVRSFSSRCLHTREYDPRARQFRSPLMLDDFELDSERSRDWSAALVQYAVAQRPANAELLKQWVTHWNRRSYLSMEALVELFGPAPRPLNPRLLQQRKCGPHSRCGLNMVEI